MCRRRPERSRAWPRPCASLRPRGRRSSIWRAKRDPVAPAAPAVELPAHVLTLPSLFRGPAYLLDHAWTARAWNGAASRLFVGWLDDKSHDRNLLRFVFLSPTARALLTDWPERARRLVAEFRADYSRRPRDAGMQSLVSELSESSRLFRSLWQAQEVLHREGGERAFHQPVDGSSQFLQTTLLPASHPECKLVCLAPIAPQKRIRKRALRAAKRAAAFVVRPALG
jgi:hypothetical protein